MALAGALAGSVAIPLRPCYAVLESAIPNPPTPHPELEYARLRTDFAALSTRSGLKSHDPNSRRSHPFGCKIEGFVLPVRAQNISFRKNGTALSSGSGFKLYSAGMELGLPVRAQAEIGRADGQAEPQAVSETEVGADDNGRKGWSGEQDRKQAQTLLDSTIYPIMRVFKDDLCTLEITGDAQAWQALQALAADGGITAAEELDKERLLMTVETIIPGRQTEHSTVSTKLIAPTSSVNKAAKNIWMKKKMPSGSSGNALAMAFQKVVLNHVLSFDIRIRSPGTARDMANLGNETEGAVMASVESRDGKILEGLAEVISAYSMACVKEDFFQKSSGKSRNKNVSTFWRKPDWTWALNKVVGIRRLSDGEIKEHAKKIVAGLKSIRETQRTYQAWWPAPSVSLPSETLPEKCPDSWITEFIPVHKLSIDTSKVKVIVKGWQPTKNNQVLELDLTHAQLVDVADTLDLYYTDKYTIPAKRLRSSVDTRLPPSQSKVAQTVWRVVLSCIAGGVLLVGFLVAAKLRTLSSAELLSSAPSITSTSMKDESFTNKWCRVQNDRQALLPKNEDIPAEEIELLCVEVLKKVKEAFDVAGEVESSPERGAWIGADLSQLGRSQSSAETRVDNTDTTDLQEETQVDNTDTADQQEETQTAEDKVYNVETSAANSSLESLEEKSILLYQVVLTRTAKVVGFQPGNKAAIGLWASFPFAKELHKGRKLGAGLWERGLKYVLLSEDVVAIELICQTSSSPPAFTARPLQL